MKAKLLEVEELYEMPVTYVLWIEDKEQNKIRPAPILDPDKEIYCQKVGSYISFSCLYYRIDDYNKHWRCWQYKPTIEERENIKWME